MPNTEVLLSRLEKVRSNGADRWVACCPAHQDASPSLSIRVVEDRILIHCFAGCSPISIIEAVELSLSDLFDTPLPNKPSMLHSRPRSFPSDLNRVSMDEWVVLLGNEAKIPLTEEDKARYKKALVAVSRQRSREVL